MNDTDATIGEAAAEARGRARGYAVAALAAGCVAFVNLLGAEKALLAIALAVLALRGPPSPSARAWARGAIVLGALQLVALLAVLVLYHDKLRHLAALLKDLA